LASIIRGSKSTSDAIIRILSFVVIKKLMTWLTESTGWITAGFRTWDKEESFSSRLEGD